LLVLALAAAGEISAQEQTPLISYQTIRLNSTVMGAQQDLLVRTPPRYDTSSARYPVVYLLDPDQHFPYVAAMLDALAARWNEFAPPVILVGVRSRDRIRDFTTPVGPGVPVPAHMQEIGGSDRFRHFLVSEVIPAVEQRFRTAPLRVLIGHSLSGLIALRMMARQPDVFRGIVALDPSAWWNNGELLTDLDALSTSPPQRDVRLFVARGIGRKGAPVPVPPGNQQLEQRLQTASFPNLRVAYLALDDETHNTMPIAGAYYGLRHVFHDYLMPNAIQPKEQDVTVHYENLSKVWGYSVAPPPGLRSRIQR
jgi:predicted alpha/beta superfamily hydrolase